MKIATLLASAAAVALARPTASSNEDISKRQQNIIYPHGTFRYWINTGEIKEDPQDQLLVVKNGNTADETSTIVTFNVPPELEGRTCNLLFDLWNRDVSTGTQDLDVFTVINPPVGDFSIASVKASIPKWRPAQSRDQHEGRIHVPKPGSAQWIESYHGYPQFPCPAGQLVGIEYVGVGDAVTVRWDIGVTGPRIQPL